MESMKQAPEMRGSEQVSEEMFHRPNEISKEDLRQVISAVRSQGAMVTGWWIKGKPGIDSIYGSVQVKPELAGKLIQDLVTVRGVRLNLDVFPIGIINPDLVHINFATPGAGR